MRFDLVKLAFLLLATLSSSQEFGFTFNGFSLLNMSLDGVASILPGGILELTDTTPFGVGHAFYKDAIRFKSGRSVFSFSCVFVVAIRPQNTELGANGMTFVISPTKSRPKAQSNAYLGLFNESTAGSKSNHVFAVELDTFRSEQASDTDNNHAGIDINDIKSLNSTPAGYFSNKNGKFQNMSLISGDAITVWVDYNSSKNRIEVTMAPEGGQRPRRPLMSTNYNLSQILEDVMYIGFTSSTDAIQSRHYVLGWSFQMNGEAEPLSPSLLPRLPRFRPKKVADFYKYGIPLISICLIFGLALVLIYVIRNKKRFAEEVEDWELAYRAHRFKLKDLYHATKGFTHKNALGSGGFGTVYRGVLQKTKAEVAVKKISHETTQGMKGFVAEIVSIGRMSHRNIVPLLGYCRRKGELLLVYDYMPNGSLDRFLYDSPKMTLSWSQRMKIIKEVASALFYLHEEWEQVVVHRDVKASNVLLDAEWNARLGDFGLARLYDHGSDPHTTLVVGTFGYLAPEYTRTGRATTSTDVFAFGAFILEVACGRKPIETQRQANEESVFLLGWVYEFWVRGDILGAADPKLDPDFIKDEVQLVLKLGLLCSHSDPKTRPSMRQVLQYLQGESPLPEFSPEDVAPSNLLFSSREGFSGFVMSHSSSVFQGFSHSSSVAESLLSGGR